MVSFYGVFDNSKLKGMEKVTLLCSELIIIYQFGLLALIKVVWLWQQGN